MDVALIKEVFSDEEFVQGLLRLEEPAEVQAALMEKGIELTEEEVVKVGEQINQYVESGAVSEELSLEQLENVAGGMVVETILVVAIYAFAAIVGAGGVTGGYFLGRFLANLRW